VSKWTTILLKNGEKAFARKALANPHRFMSLKNESLVVVVSSDGIRLYDEQEMPLEIPGDGSLLVSILKQSIRATELAPFFRTKSIADDVAAQFCLQRLDELLANEDKVWRLITMSDKGLMLAKSRFAHRSQKYPYRFVPIVVGVRRNGLYLYRKPLSASNPPRQEDLFLYIAPHHIEPQLLSGLFTLMEGAEITAAFRLNRRELLTLVDTGQAAGNSLETKNKRGHH
jgi:hypothetical protein